jgi:hypothetical protein
MGKMQSSDTSHFCHYVTDFKDVFTSDGIVLFCQACGKPVVAQYRSEVTHLSGSKYITAIA